eukprot:230640_1
MEHFSESKTNNTSCLEPLLQSDNHQLSEKQKDVLKHLIVKHNIQQDAEYDVEPLNVSYRHRRDSDLNSMSTHFGVKWWPLLTVTFIICASSFTFGYVTIQTSLIIDTSTPVNIGALNNNYHLTLFEKQSLIPSSSLIGASIGSISMLFYPSVKYGRKHILLLSNVPIILGCILCICAVSPVMVTIGFVFEGIGFGISSVVAPVLLSEIAPTPVRSFITIFHQLFITFGILMASVFTLPLIQVTHGWRYIVSVIIVVSCVQLLFLRRIPESPRWLIAKGELDRAKQVISTFYKTQVESDHEYENIYKYISSNEHVAIESWNAMREWIHPLIVGVILNVFDQWTGVNVIMYRSQDALKNQRIDENIFIAIIIIYLINFMSTIICIICVKKNDISNKTLLYIGTCLMLLSSLFLGLINSTYHGDQNLVDQLSISQLPLYVFGFAISLGVFKWIVITESFPLSNRVRFASICVFAQWSCNAALSLSLHQLIHFLNANDNDNDDNDGVANLYFIFCATLTLCIGFIWQYIPKTKGESLENSVKIYNRNIIFAN